jgi:hypothetical protein
MARRCMAVFPTLAMVWILLSVRGLAVAQEPAEGTAETPPAEASSQPCAQPAPCFALPRVPVCVGAPRPYRRGPLPAVGVYVGPRALYPGTLAPWGSVPAWFYAASYPLYPVAYHVPLEPGHSEYPIGKAVTPYRTDPEASAPTPRRADKPDSAPDPFAPEAIPSMAAPESIPAPQPMDVPKLDGPYRSGGLINPGGKGPGVRPPTPKPGSLPQSATGPREF